MYRTIVIAASVMLVGCGGEAAEGDEWERESAIDAAQEFGSRVSCTDCNDGNPCTEDLFVNNSCKHSHHQDGSQCSAFPVMVCLKGECQ